MFVIQVNICRYGSFYCKKFIVLFCNLRARDHCCVLCDVTRDLLLGSLSNYDDNNNNNDDFKKTIGLMIKTTALLVHHAF